MVAACGSSIAGQANDVSPTDVDVATSDAMMTQLYMDIAGTPAQRTEQEFLIHSRLQGAIDDCMAEAGFRYSLPAFWDPYAGMTDFGPPEPVPEAASADVARAARVGFGIAQQVEASEYSGEDDTAYLALSAAGRAAYDEALNKCSELPERRRDPRLRPGPHRPADQSGRRSSEAFRSTRRRRRVRRLTAR